MRLDVQGIVKRFGAVTALNGVDLAVEEGEFLTILGPSGSGKTTLLKAVAGFEVPDAGTVRLGDRDVTTAPARHRNVGMVFQNYALFPHMTVAENLAFPLEMRGTGKAAIARRVAEALALVELGGYAERLPRQLSGGQQQRVALARAIIFDPSLLLLDEPFGALDRKLRESLQLEVRRLQRRLKLTTLFITHDQEEALVMSDRIAVMDQGRIQQLGTPGEIYDFPVTRFVANFIGESNLIEATAQGGRVSVPGFGTMTLPEAPAPGPVTLLLRPEALRLGAEAGAAACHATATVLESVFLGLSVKLRLQPEGAPEMLARLPLRPSDPPPAAEGSTITIGFRPEDVHVVPRG
ncbi:ABC transporter ATP-binding protein [Roseococcus sp. SYP-B2431]|uniref:ABC transporter ATP-binding protein n=1 Tax=Roseococcus sp. SYP-B2431 TaxID=2496640 RepID=UPI0010398294|nr:ABC transporter ATP-binding protein [Roseococcus sp. SYP-B2431]TCI00137.1 ABC transporter ATP-binding protein [Roseococcus sp. SYP-B2431]